MTEDEMRAFAQQHGIPALLDHLGLDELGNHVNDLIAAARVAMDYIEPDIDGDTEGNAYRVHRQLQAAVTAASRQGTRG
jgi:hypothetical protein